MKSEKELQQSILKLLVTSGIPEKDKELIRFSVPFMLQVDLEALDSILSDEAKALNQLGEEKKRLLMRYEIMLQKLQTIEENRLKNK